MIFKLINKFSLDDKFEYEFGGTVDDIIVLLEEHLKNPINLLHLLNCEIPSNTDPEIVKYLSDRANNILYMNNLTQKYAFRVGNDDDSGELELLYHAPTQDDIIDKIRDLVSDDWSPQYDAGCIVDAYNRDGSYCDTKIEIIKLPTIENPKIGICRQFMSELNYRDFDCEIENLKWVKYNENLDDFVRLSYVSDITNYMIVIKENNIIMYTIESDSHLALIEGIMNNTIQLITSIDIDDIDDIEDLYYSSCIDLSDLGVDPNYDPNFESDDDSYDDFESDDESD